MESSVNEVSVNIVFENEDFAVLNKPRGVPTAPLKEGDASLLTQFLSLGHVKEKVIGKKEVEAGLLHRLDTATTGLVLIAKTQKMFDILKDMQDYNLIEKEYFAFSELVPSQIRYSPRDIKKMGSLYSFNITSSFVSCGKRGHKVKIVNFNGENLNNSPFASNKKQYITEVFIEDGRLSDVWTSIFNGRKPLKNDRLCQIHCICRLKQGYRHQVRVHLSSIGLPIKGDALYNTHYIKQMGANIEKEVSTSSYPLSLYATKLTFPSPYKYTINDAFGGRKFKELLSFSLPQLDKKNL